MPLVMRRLTTLAGGLDHPAAIAIQADGTIWISGEAGQIYKATSDGKKFTQVGTAPAPIVGLALAPGDGWLAIGHNDGLCRFNIAAGKVEPIPTFVGVPGGLCFLHDGRLLVTERSKPAKGRLFLVEVGGAVTDCKVGALADPRGMALNNLADGLFIVCREMPGVMICAMEKGMPGKAKPFALLAGALPECVVIDHRSNLYVGCHSPTRIFKVAPDRWVTNHIEDPRMETLSQPVGLAWTGKGFDQLIAVNRGAHHLTQIDMQQIGLGTVNQR